MEFNGRTIIIIGSLLFIFQLANFYSIDAITPSLERAQVLSALSSVIIILIGFLFNEFNPISDKKVDIKGDIKFLYDTKIPNTVLDELAWGSEAILTSTAAASILIHNNGENILRRGIISNDLFRPGDTCLRSLKEMKLISLANTKFYPGRVEFDSFCPNIPSILIVPIDNKSFILIGGWSSRCFTKSDESWIKNWSKKLKQLFSDNSI